MTTIAPPLAFDAHVAEILTRAADLITDNGHERGYYWPGAPADLWRPGTRLDVTAAIGVALGYTRSGDVEWEIVRASVTHGDDQPHSAFAAVMAHLEVDSMQGVWMWSDRHTAAEVVAMLRDCAASVTCLSCGAPYGSPHRAGCAFETAADVAA